MLATGVISGRWRLYGGRLPVSTDSNVPALAHIEPAQTNIDSDRSEQCNYLPECSEPSRQTGVNSEDSEHAKCLGQPRIRGRDSE